MKKLVLLHVIIALLLVGCTSSITDIYIFTEGNTAQLKDGELAFSSIEEGIDAVSGLRKEGNKNAITLHISAGEHRISAPIRIGPELGSLKLIGEGSDRTVIKGSKIIDT